MARKLLEMGADPNVPDEDGWTLLFHAASRCDADMVALLVDYGANAAYARRSKDVTVGSEGVFLQVLDGWEPLINCVGERGRGDAVRTIRLLLAHGADLGGDPSPLWRAALRGDPDVVRALLAHGARVDRGDWWETPLSAAVRAGHLEVARVIVDEGPGPEFLAAILCEDAPSVARRLANDPSVIGSNCQGRSALRWAALAGRADVVDVLLAAGADANAKDEHGDTALHDACLAGRLAAAEALLARGADVNATNASGDTPLHDAVRWRQAAAVEFLLEHGADANAVDKHGRAALHLVAQIAGRRSADMAAVLLDYEADTEARNEMGETPLFVAAKSGNSEVGSLLLRRGAAAGASDDRRGWPPLLAAAWVGDDALVSALLQHGADANWTDSDGGASCLHWLSRNDGRGDVVATARALLAGGARAELRDWAGRTPLFDAVKAGRKELAQVLFEAAPGPDLVRRVLFEDAAAVGRSLANNRGMASAEHQGWSALHWAVLGKRADIVELLLEAGADADARDVSQRTPLHLAAREGQFRIVELLLAHGADANLFSDIGWTPLHEAIRDNHLAVAALLLDHGADVNAQRGGKTPLALALWFSSWGQEMALLLRRHGGVE